MASAIDADTALIYIANPNNPTGTHLRLQRSIEVFWRVFHRHVVVVIDEAYNEYLPPEQRFDSVRMGAQVSESC